MAGKVRTTLLVAALVVGAGASAANAATHKPAKKHVLKPISMKFYMNGNAADGSCTEDPALSTKLDGGGSEGCGIVGGVPLEEVFYQAGSPDTTTYSTKKGDGMPLLVDVKRKITGQVGTESWTGVVGGAGTVTVELEIDAITTSGQSVVISTQTLTKTLSPNGGAVTNLPWSASIPGSLAGKTLSSLSVSTTIHGTYVDQGAKHYDGDSFVVVPGLK